jgi:hypothetical protein
MNISMNNIMYTIREICFGSNDITISRILLRTFLILLAYLMVSNRDMISLLTGFTSVSSFKSNADFLEFLEKLKIDELTVLVPIVCTLTFTISSSIYYKRSSQLQILPISPIEKIFSYLVVILAITIISLFFNFGLQYVLVYIIQKMYQSEMIILQEEIGDLYKYLDKNYVLSTDYEIRISTFPVIIISLSANLFILVSNMLFTKLGIIKGILLVILTLVAAALVHRWIINFSGTNISTNVAYDIFYSVYLPLVIICMICCLYFLLKQKEG